MHVYDGVKRLTGNPLEPPQAHYSSVKTRALPPQSDADIDDDYLSLDYGRVPYRMSVAQNREVGYNNEVLLFLQKNFFISTNIGVGAIDLLFIAISV